MLCRRMQNVAVGYLGAIVLVTVATVGAFGCSSDDGAPQTADTGNSVAGDAGDAVVRDTGDATETTDVTDVSDTNGGGINEPDSGCHIDCFGGVSCENGEVYQLSYGAKPCSAGASCGPGTLMGTCEYGCREDYQEHVGEGDVGAGWENACRPAPADAGDAGGDAADASASDAEDGGGG